MMASKPKKPATPEAEKFPRKAVPLLLDKGDSEEAAAGKFAKLATSPELAAYRAINASETKSGFDEHIDVPAMLSQLKEQAAAVNRGDMTQAEAMLMNQATALQSLFSRLTEKAMGAEYLANFEAFMRTALRAQSQCRATLETLSTIKNPPVIYAKQVNQTTGPQQINNGMASQAQGIENGQSKLLDTGATGETIPSYSTLEAVGEIDRAKVPRG